MADATMEDYIYVSSDDDYDYVDCEDDVDDDDGGDFNGDYEYSEFAETTAGAVSKSGNVKVITKESLLAAQGEDLRRVMDLLSLKEHHARSLLIHYRWDFEKVLSVLVEKGKDELYAEAGVTILEHQDLVSSMVMCMICFEEVLANAVTTMDCGHIFCNTCWTEHFIVKITEGQSRRIKCMAPKCNVICDEEIVRILVSARDPILAEKFDRFLLESYIDDNRKVKWCPSVPHCGKALRIDDNDLCEVECACGLQFCFKCSSEAHSPCSCLMWELWSKKCKDESETINWMTVHTKPCPKCFKPVEKNGGCNLVSCICGQPFCWLCGSATGKDHTYHSIAGHSCGRYKEAQDNAERAKRDLYRYMHYHNRYKAHAHSFEIECKLKNTVKEKISELEAKGVSCKDFGWVINGLKRLFRSRRFLSYSYAFAYYMFGDDLFRGEMTEKDKEIKKNLFEDQQQQLEAHVEKLSSFLEQPFNEFPDDKIMNLRMDVINLSSITDKLCRKLYECIENDLLGSFQWTSHCIAPYMSDGADKASELTDSISSVIPK